MEGETGAMLQQSLLTVLLVRYLPARVLPLSLTASPSVPVLLLLLLLLVPMLVLVQADMLCTAVTPCRAEMLALSSSR